MLDTRIRIIRFERHIEEMLAVHPGVHHEISIERRALPGLEGRRTDDRHGRSTALYHSDRRRRIESQRAVTRVRDRELSPHHLVERLFAQVDALSVECQARADLTRARISGLEVNQGDGNDDENRSPGEHPKGEIIIL